LWFCSTGNNTSSTNRFSKKNSVAPSIENPLIKVAHRPAAKLIRLELASAQACLNVLFDPISVTLMFFY
jgi:hypothetical protein